nr:SDR family oxidoreductase [uncultured Lacibacter sp.]
MSDLFDGKVIIITGSSMGIGKALAKNTGYRKAKIVLNARSAEKLAATERELKQFGFDVCSFTGDVTKEEDCNKLIDFTIKQHGRIDILVNNAGASMRGMIETVSPSVMTYIYQVNSIAPLMLTKIALPHLKKTKGSVVFISSLAGLRGLPFISIYCSAKMALTAIAQALRVEHAADNVHVGIVYVGITKIEADKTAIGANGELVPLEERTGMFKATPETVADRIVQNIRRRKKQTVIGIPGKLFFFLSRYFPGIIELMVKRSYKKMSKLYK